MKNDIFTGQNPDASSNIRKDTKSLNATVVSYTHTLKAITKAIIKMRKL